MPKIIMRCGDEIIVTDDRTLAEAKAERKDIFKLICAEQIKKYAPIEKQLSASFGLYSVGESAFIQSHVRLCLEKYEALKTQLESLDSNDSVDSLNWPEG